MSAAPAAVRLERDLLGEREVPAGALHGVHTERALENFPLARRAVHPALARAFGAVKLACATANHALGHLDDATFEAIARACRELRDGDLARHVVVDALQGGAGTSTNMNVNEVLANRALELLGHARGDYARVHPEGHVNLHQSTNDTFPTALRVAAIDLGRALEQELLALVEALQRGEQRFAGVVKLGRTEAMDAVPITLGRELGAWAEAFGRDRWRIYKCEERLRVVNLGGTAIGTCIGAPRDYVFRVVDDLRAVTGYGLARAENLVEATQNADVLAEVSGLLRTCAVSLFKVSSDLRFLASGPDGGIAEVRLPAVQAGSSIMPGKVNPVVPEAVSQVALVVMGHDATITQACALGHLELNPFLPLVADALLSSFELLARAVRLLRERAIEGLEADEARCRSRVDAATATVTALVEEIGYVAAEAAAQAARAEGRPLRDVVVARGWMTAARFDELTSAARTLRLGAPPRRDARSGDER
jgi:aspartate ammonia-lyase